jgi:hypothetical protein
MLSYVRKVPGSNLGQPIYYTEVYHGVPKALQVNVGLYLETGHGTCFQFFPYSTFMIVFPTHPTLHNI